jgi:hypothetical protein
MIVITDKDYLPIKEDVMSDEEIQKSGHHPADWNGDGKVTDEERDMYLEFRRRELEDQDAMRDAQRNMTWFALSGMLLYPATVMTTEFLELHQAAEILGAMASVYFVSVAGIVAAFFGAQAWSGKK